MFRKLAAAFVLVMALAGISWPYTGTGTSADPYIINTYSDFRTLMQGAAPTAADGKYFKLSCDIQLSGVSDWEPAGTLSAPFTGHFDGQGHIIYINLQPLPVSVTQTNYIRLTYDRSLFGVVDSDGDAIVSLDVEGVVRGYNAGGLVSVLKGGNIRNCVFSGDVIVETSPEGQEAMNELLYELGDSDIVDANGVEILDDVNTKTIVYGKINAGGIAAVMLGGSIEASTFRGNVTASADLTPACAGGIVGRMIEDSEAISGCMVEGDAVITASTAANSYTVFASAGGIAGYANTQLDNTIESCTFSGYVNSTYYAGGIAGLVRGTILSGDALSSTSKVTGTYSAGGIAGYMASGAWAKSNTTASGSTVTAETYSAGGIIGLLETSGRVVEGNTSYAAIRGNATYQGGIVGALGNSTSSSTSIGSGNAYSGADYGIGRDEWGNSTDGSGSGTITQNSDVTYVITTTTLTGAVVGTYYTASLDTSAPSSKTVTWTYSGTFPPGLTADSSGNITGTPTMAGTYTFTASADISSYTKIISAEISITIAEQDSASTSDLAIATESLSSGIQDTYYYAYLIATGYTTYDSVSWTIAAGSLPDGLTLEDAAFYDNDTRGFLSGSPTVSGTFSFTVMVTLISGTNTYFATKNFSLYIAPSGLIISTDAELPDASLNKTYSATLEAYSASSSISNVRWSISEGSMPEGVSLSRTTGLISGTPSESGEFTFTVTATANGLTGSKEFTLVVNDADFTITTGSILTPGIVGAEYTETLSHDAGTSASPVWYVYSGTLPSGLELSRTDGTISGTPTTAGTYEFRIGLLIGSQIASKNFTLVVVPNGTTTTTTISITTDYIKPGIQDSAFSQTLTAETSGDLRIWYVYEGSLPEGLTIANSSGTISGTPTTAGNYTFTIGLYADDQITTKAFEMTIVPSDSASGYSITTSSLTPGTIGQAYSQALATDAPASLGSRVWYVDSGALPAGLSLSRSTGVISGTPAESGTFSFTVGLWTGDLIITKSFALVIIPGMTITTDRLKPAVRGKAYSATLSNDSGVAASSCVWYVDSGSLPEGLNLSSAGIISGTPTTAGTYTFTIGLLAGEYTATKSFTMTVIPATTVSDFSITTNVIKPATRGTYYSFDITTDASASLGNPTWYIDSGTLPYGLSLSSSGRISGTPTTAGSYTFTVGLFVGTQIVTKTFTMVVISATVSSDFSITTEYLISGVRGSTYSQTLTDNASTSLTPRVWYLADGELPTGLSLSRSSGTISGTPTSSGTYTFTVGLLAGGFTATKTFTLLILPSLSISTDWLKPGIQGTPYSATLSADAVVSSTSCIWYIESGSLPDGLTLARSTGTISGTPTESGSYTFTVVLFADGLTTSKAFTLFIISGTVSSGYSITTEALTPAIAGSSYVQTLVSDIPASYSPRYWYIDSGTLPEGLHISRTVGIISGTPTESGTYTFTVGLLAGNQLLFKEFTLTVIPGTSITTEALPPGTEGKSYSQTLTSDSSASGTRIWYIDTGELPPGLTLARNTGVISGTPTKSGTYSFRVRLLIGEQITAKTFTLLIVPGLAISGDTLPEGKEGETYSYTFTVSADTAVWAHTAGTLPPGLALSTSGTLSGTPIKSGTYSFTVRAVSSAEGLRVERTLSLTIRPVFSILTDAALTRAKVSTWYSLTLSADAESSYMVSWKLLDGTLPGGLYLNSSTGNISGTPQAEGTYSFTIQASAGSYIAAKRFTLIVDPALEILTEAQLPSWKLNKYYSLLFTTDSALPVHWSLTDGSIPTGLYFADGVLDGTPTATGTYSFTLTAESGGMTASKTFTMTIKPALSITTPEILPSVKAKAYYSYTLSSDADDPSTVLWSTTYSDFYDYNGLPGGMYVDETTGTIYGTPTAEGTYTFTIRAVMGSISTSKEFTLTVRPMLSIETGSPLPHAEVNEKYSVTLLSDADEGQTVTWSVVDGTLPDRLILDAQTGELSGYILNEGIYSFTIQAFSNGLTARKRFELTAGVIMSIIASKTDPVLEAGEYFEMTLLTDKANAVNTKWAVIDGILPPGIDLNTSTGVISGTPSRAGTYTITVQAVADYSIAQKELTLIVDFMISSEWILPNGAVGEPYSYRFTAKGVSTSAVLWTVSSDSVLPTGLTLATNGILSGTTNHAGKYTFMLYAFVSNDVSAMQTVRLTVDANPDSAVPVLTMNLPDGQVSQDYYAELRAGISGVTWQLESGEIPDGLTLRADGLISGVPTKAGVYAFIVRVSESNRTSTRQFTITIKDVAPEPERVSYGSGGGGGCDSGFGMMGLAALGLMFRKRQQ